MPLPKKKKAEETEKPPEPKKVKWSLADVKATTRETNQRWCEANVLVGFLGFRDLETESPRWKEFQARVADVSASLDKLKAVVK